MSLEKSDLHRFFSGSTRNGTRRLLHPAHHGGSGTITGGAHNMFEFIVARSSTADGNRTPSHVTFSRVYPHSLCCLTRHQVFVRVIPSMCHALVCLISLRPSFCTLHPPDLSLQLLCGLVRSYTPCALSRMRSLAHWPTMPLSHFLGSPALPPLRLTGGFCLADWTVPRQDVNLRVPPLLARSVCTHAGSGPRESAAACYWHAWWTPSPWPPVSLKYS